MGRLSGSARTVRQDERAARARMFVGQPCRLTIDRGVVVEPAPDRGDRPRARARADRPAPADTRRCRPRGACRRARHRARIAVRDPRSVLDSVASRPGLRGDWSGGRVIPHTVVPPHPADIPAQSTMNSAQRMALPSPRPLRSIGAAVFRDNRAGFGPVALRWRAGGHVGHRRLDQCLAIGNCHRQVRTRHPEMRQELDIPGGAAQR